MSRKTNKSLIFISLAASAIIIALAILIPPQPRTSGQALPLDFELRNTQAYATYVAAIDQTTTPEPTGTPAGTPAAPITPRTVVYFGGNITDGAGATSKESTSWRSLASRWLHANYPDIDWTYYNAGLAGSHSWDGLARLQADVIERQPDIVFLDFAAYDAAIDRRGSHPEGFVPAAEALIRRLRTALPETRLVVWIFAKPEAYAGLIENEKLARDKWAALAAHYNLPVLRFDLELERLIGRSEPGYVGVDDYFGPDNRAYPNNAGHRLAYELMLPLLGDILFPQPRLPLPALYYSGTTDYARPPQRIAGQDLLQTPQGGWYLEGTGIESLTEGDTVTYTGAFSSFGLDTNFGEGAGILALQIDGGQEIYLDLAVRKRSNHFIWSFPHGPHTLTLRVVSAPVRINHLIII